MNKKSDPAADALLKADDITPEDLNLTTSNSQQTAKKAAKILERYGFVTPTAKQKKILLIAFAKRNKVIYGKAFDVLKVQGDIVVDLNNQDDVEAKLDNIILYEIKSTNQKLDDEFTGFFFALTTAELLVAQNLKSSYSFVLVNTTNEKFIERSLNQIFGQAKGIYPTWSIRF